MKRRDLRGFGCAFLGLGLLIASYPALAQTAAPSTAAPAPMAKAAAKPAAKKVVRWAPRSRWARRYTRWAPRSRWARKPATVWHPAAYTAKPGVQTAAKPAWHPTYAAKPAPKTPWHPVTKPAAWTKPAQKPAAAAWHGATQAKQASKITTSKATAKPAPKPAAKPAVKTAAKPVAKPQPAPLSMTRDANNGGAAPATSAPLAGGSLDLGGTIGHWIGWLVAVLLATAGCLYLARRFKLVPVANNAGAAPQGYAQNGNGKGAGQVITPVFSNLGNGRTGNGVAPNDLALDQSGIGDGGLKIVGMQPLPGSGTIIYLVQIEDHLVLLGASQAGGVRTLAEWEQDNQPAAEKEKAAFDSFLRQQGIAAVSPRAEEEEHTFASIRARLNSTADRLAGLRADFGS